MRQFILVGASWLSVVVHAMAIQCPDLNHLSGLGLSARVHYNATIVETGRLDVATVVTNKMSVCRIVGSIDYGNSGNHTLAFELWLPERTKYNGRYVAMGTLVRLPSTCRRILIFDRERWLWRPHRLCRHDGQSESGICSCRVRSEPAPTQSLSNQVIGATRGIRFLRMASLSRASPDLMLHFSMTAPKPCPGCETRLPCSPNLPEVCLLLTTEGRLLECTTMGAQPVVVRALPLHNTIPISSMVSSLAVRQTGTRM
jgi:hypothetical protein